MISKSEQERIRTETVALLRDVNRYTEQDIFNKYPTSSTGDERTLKLLIWEAREEVRLKDGIDFGPLARWPGVFERKQWNQIAGRAARQRAKGTRAQRRAGERFRLAATMAPDPEKDRLSDAADRIALRQAMRAAKA